jgi:PleD family two-component response regulator
LDKLIMILAVLNDLLFASKIRTTAAQIGAEVSIAKTPDAALDAIRASPPALVIIDLNNGPADPLQILAAMQQDPALAHVPTLGFVSHVQTGLIDAARRAGIGEVMPRSAFAMRLPDILARG